MIRNRGVLSAVAERDADDADCTAVEPFSALTATANVDLGAVFSVRTADFVVKIQRFHRSGALLIQKSCII